MLSRWGRALSCLDELSTIGQICTCRERAHAASRATADGRGAREIHQPACPGPGLAPGGTPAHLHSSNEVAGSLPDPFYETKGVQDVQPPLRAVEKVSGRVAPAVALWM